MMNAGVVTVHTKYDQKSTEDTSFSPTPCMVVTVPESNQKAVFMKNDQMKPS